MEPDAVGDHNVLRVSSCSFYFPVRCWVRLSDRLTSWCFSNKHAGSHPEAFWSRPVLAVTASVQPE